MPVYLFTFHAHRSWNADNPRGYVKRGKGIQPPDPDQAKFYDEQAKHPRVWFDPPLQQALVWGAHDIARRRAWELRCVTTEPTHVHILLRWKKGQWQSRDVRRILKNILSYLLGKFTGASGGHWFIRDGSRKAVQDREHYQYLLKEYLPRHRGRCWYEGDAAPEEQVWKNPPAGRK